MSPANIYFRLFATLIRCYRVLLKKFSQKTRFCCDNLAGEENEVDEKPVSGEFIGEIPN